MSNTKNYIAALLIGLGGFALLAFGWPTYSQISDLKSAVREREVVFQERKSTIEKIGKFISEYKKKASEVTKLSSVIPAKKSEAELISTLEDISTKTGLQLSTMRITVEQGQNNESQYKNMAIEVTFNGSYQSLVSFLEALEKNIRIIDVSTIQISSNQGVLSYKVKANTYVLK